MAKKDNANELLSWVLEDLDELLTMAKDAKKQSEDSSKQSNVPQSSIANVLKQVPPSTDILNNLNAVVAIKTLSTISNKEVSNMVNVMKTLSSAMKEFQISENDAKGFNLMLSSFVQLNDVFAKLSASTFKNFLKFNPVTGKMLGSQIGSFYKALMEGFENEKLGDFLKNFKDSQNIGQNLSGFSQLISSIFAIDYKQLLKIGSALMLFPDSAGKNLSGFFKPIIDVINMLPADHNTEQVFIHNGDKDEYKYAFSADSRIKSFMDIFNMFAGVSLKSLYVMGKLGKNLTEAQGNNISAFFKPVVKTIKDMPGSKKFNANVENFIKLFNMFAGFSLIAIARIALMGSVLNAKQGEKIGAFFAALVKKINEPGQKATENALNMVKSFSMMMTTLTLSFVALTAMVMLAKPSDIAIASGILLGLVGLSLVTIKLLSGQSIQKSAQGSLYTAASIGILIGSLTLSLSLLTAIVAHNKWEDIARGMGALAIITIGSIGLIKLLSGNNIKSSTKGALVTVAAISLLMLAMSAVSLLAIETGKHAKDSLLGLALIAALTAGAIVVIKMLDKIGENKKALLNSVLAIGVLTLGIAAISGAMILFGKYLQQVKDVSAGQILAAGAVALGMIATVSTIMIAAAALVSGPQAVLFAIALGATLTLSAGIAAISGSLLSFANLINTTKAMSLADISDASSKMLGEGGMISFLKEIINGLSDIGAKGAIKMGIIGGSLLPLMAGIGTYIDTIAKLSSLNVIDHYDTDKDGNPRPVYRKVSDTEFANAATKLSGSLTGFLNDLYNNLSSKDKQQTIKNIMKLFKKGDFGQLMQSVGTFASAIANFSTMSIPDKWDSNGNPIHYRQLSDTEFTNAATALSGAFTTFLVELDNSLSGNEDLMKRLSKMFGSEKSKDSISNIITSVVSTIEPLAQISSGKWNDMAVSKAGLEGAVDTLLAPISKFLEIMQTLDASATKKAYIATNVANYLRNLSSTIEKINGETYAANCASLLEGTKTLFIIVDETTEDRSKKATFFRDALTKIATGFSQVSPAMSKAATPIEKATKAMAQLDSVILSRRNERNEAIIEVTDGFKGMTEQLSLLNDEFARSIELMHKERELEMMQQENMFRQFASGMQNVGSGINNAVSNIKTALVGPEKQVDNNAGNQAIDSVSLVGALTAALNAWSSSTKNITLELSDQGVMAIGKVYMGDR